MSLRVANSPHALDQQKSFSRSLAFSDFNRQTRPLIATLNDVAGPDRDYSAAGGVLDSDYVRGRKKTKKRTTRKYARARTELTTPVLTPETEFLFPTANTS